MIDTLQSSQTKVDYIKSVRPVTPEMSLHATSATRSAPSSQSTNSADVLPTSSEVEVNKYHTYVHMQSMPSKQSLLPILRP